MSDNSTLIRTSQVLGITASGILAGGILNFSTVLVPTLLLPATTSRRTFDSSFQPGTPVSHITSQWHHAYSLGKSFVPLASLITASAYSYLSYHFRQGTLTRQGNVVAANYYLFAALLTVLPVPFTLLIMKPTNSKLITKAESAEREGIVAHKEGDVQSELKASREEAEVQSWLKTWASLNTVRGLFPFAATICAAIATIS
ncbi:predicted protein [Uncinocarpus reesii 1704]|uniref:DUF1772-domain-containing protein n=1 Tax=Uncinocarpus reesii (strain UAMH 1704) TaxID=336963 RepID=C4JJJ3_UNCRE|nr:uncharacterized protein UREG_01800 [Uncinocarpus reesii 1704]EEP76951.1 predicted protein [Uncinocarpus reesii 1704]